jgi:arginine exporter protein ArgO
MTHFISAKIDTWVLSARQLALWAALGVVGLTAAVGLVITAIVLVLVGAAEGFALLFGGRWWLGAIVVGSGIIVLLILGVLIGMRTWHSRWRQQKVHQYDERQRQQQATYGHSVAERATAAAAVQH